MIKRTPFVLAGTIAGLVGLLSFRSTPAKMTLGAAAGASSASSSATGSPSAGTGSGATPSGASSAASSSSSSSNSSSASSSTASGATQSATGPLVNYYFGVLSVKVTATGSKIDAVTIGSIQDGGNPLSASIDHMAIPQLESEAMSVQGAGIQGVSGASYTSAGFKMSLQGALTKLGIK